MQRTDTGLTLQSVVTALEAVRRRWGGANATAGAREGGDPFSSDLRDSVKKHLEFFTETERKREEPDVGEEEKKKGLSRHCTATETLLQTGTKTETRAAL